MKKYGAILLGLIIITVLFGCERQIESENLSFDLPVEPPTPISLQVAHITDGIQLEWQTSDTLAGMSFNVYYSDSLEGEYILWENTDDFSSIITALESATLYYFKVSSVTSDGLEGLRSRAVSSQVGVVSVIINGGDDYTNGRNVSVSFVIPQPAALVQLSENVDLSDAHWENYSATKGFLLSPGDGTKYIYAAFRFTDGSEAGVASSITDSIILDTEAEIDSVYFEPDDIIFGRGSVVTFYLLTDEKEAEASVSLPGVNNIKLPQAAENGGIYTYSRTYTIPDNVEVIAGQVIGNLTDAAGNSAPPVAAPVLINISNPPKPVTVTAVTESSSRIRLTWSQAVDNDFAAYHLYRDTIQPVTNSADPIAIITNRSELSYSDTDLDDNTEYYYRLYVYDRAGLNAPSNTTSAVTLVNQAPSPVTLAVRLEDDAGDIVVELSWTQNEDSDFESYRIYRTTSVSPDLGNATLLEITNTQTITTFTDNATAGTYYYGVVVYDIQGASSGEPDWVEITVP